MQGPCTHLPRWLEPGFLLGRFDPSEGVYYLVVKPCLATTWRIYNARILYFRQLQTLITSLLYQWRAFVEIYSIRRMRHNLGPDGGVTLASTGPKKCYVKPDDEMIEGFMGLERQLPWAIMA